MSEPAPVAFGMGWFPHWDPRNWMMSDFIDYGLSLPTSRYHTVRRVLNQGATNSCVGHGGRHDLEATPIPVPIEVGPDAMMIYAQAQKLDGIPLPHEGTTMSALARYLTGAGQWTSYVWTRTLDDMIRWVLGKGPVCIGTNWHANMMQPDLRGVVTLGGGIVGGHCVTIYGYDQVSGYFRFVNSWGSWGPQAGKAWIFCRDMERLLQGGAEVVAPMEPGM